ncbi:two-component system sensor histidine kinase CreC [Chitinimonas lacunae]|uniref:histidine kinase n=1 Tax=Chitinimonas lacunae TaxID=1963018 RepID=A0ABV8MU66_9NEIS
MRIGVRLFLAYFVLVGLSGWWLFDQVADRLRPALRQSMEDTLIDTANLLAEFARADFKAGRLQDGEFARTMEAVAARRFRAEIWGVTKSGPNHRVYITDRQGRVLFDSAGLALGQDYSRWNDVYLTLRGRYGARTTRGKPDDPTTSVMYVAAPIVDRGQVIGVVTVGKPSTSVEPFFRRTLDDLAQAGGALLTASLLLGLLLAWWLSRALGRLADYARAVARGERVAPPAFQGGEVGVLGRAIEAMRVRLEGRQYVEDYVHSLTHELKSPLAAIRGAAELIDAEMPAEDQERFLANIRSEAERLTTIIDRLLALAQLESRRVLAVVEPVLLAELADQVLAAKTALLAQRGLDARLRIDPGLSVGGERFLLWQALSNLLDNAIDFSPPGGTIELAATVEGPMVVLSVRDQGAGIPDYARERLFERFYSLPRPDGGRKSTGLGLPFVREVAALHGGSVTVGNAPEGGTLAQLRLPLG